MDHEPRFRQQRWLLAGAAAACVVALLAVVALRPAESSPDGLRFLGRFHPLFVHLPIGVLVLAVLAEVASSKANVRARLDPVITPLLVVLVGTTLAAFIAGLALARGGGYPDALLGPHRWLAVVAVTLLCGSLAAWSLHRHRSSARWRAGYRALLGTSALAVGVGAHFGGSMTHGEAYLVRYAPQPFAGWFGVEPATTTIPTSPPSEEARVYADVVQPVLAKYCVNCHGPEKAKGELRLDSYAGLMQGGEAGPAIVARAPEKSRLVTMLRLPQDDVEHMPPKGKPQPSQAQVELISWWIFRGAHEHERVREVLPPGAVVELLKAANRTSRPKAAPNITPKAAHSPVAPAAEAEAPASARAVEDAPARDAAEASPGNRDLVYADSIAPMLAARCTKCHGPAKQKGKLRVDSLAALEQGGKAGPAVVSGDPAGSPLVERLRLPMAATGHMPPTDEPQLTDAQIRLVEWWIQEGADPSMPRHRLPERLAALRPPTPNVAADGGVRANTREDAEPSEPGTAPVAEPVPPIEGAAHAVSRALLAELPAEVELFADLIAPMLREHCGDCHLGEPLMGDLSVETFEDLVRAGVLVPGNPERSELLRRVTLPASDGDRMPPAGEPGLSGPELAALRFWIVEGAEADARWAKEELPAVVAGAVHDRRTARGHGLAPGHPARTRATPEERDPGHVAPVARASARGCGACAVEAGTDGSVPVLAAVGLLACLGAWIQRMRGGRRRRPVGLNPPRARRIRCDRPRAWRSGRRLWDARARRSATASHRNPCGGSR